MRICSVIILVRLTDISHLSKLPSDLKQNGTQEKTPFSGTVFNTLSHGMVRGFFASVRPKNYSLSGWNFLTANQKLLFNGFWSYHSQQNGAHHVKRYWKRARKWCLFLCTILFDVNWPFCNMCSVICFNTGMIAMSVSRAKSIFRKSEKYALGHLVKGFTIIPS